jgi:DNA-binding MarR family transcriptional regulator
MPQRREEDALPGALGRLRVALDDAYERASGQLGLTAQQAELLCAAMTPHAVGELAVALRCDRSNISRLVDRAAARGLVKRYGGDEDRRVTLIELTSSGGELARLFIASLEAQTSDLRRAWPKTKQRAATSMLTEISTALESGAKVPLKRRRGSDMAPGMTAMSSGRSRGKP